MADQWSNLTIVKVSEFEEGAAIRDIIYEKKDQLWLVVVDGSDEDAAFFAMDFIHAPAKNFDVMSIGKYKDLVKKGQLPDRLVTLNLNIVRKVEHFKDVG